MFKQYPFLFAALLVPGLSAAEWRDPTLPGNLPPSQIAELPFAEQTLNLTAIWISDTHSRATINGETVAKGETLSDGSRVLQIKPGLVVVKQNGIKKKLHLVPSVRKPVK